MKRMQIIVILLLMAAVAGFWLLGQVQPREETFTVAIAPQKGFRVVSANPVTVQRGEDACFSIELEENYIFSDTTLGSYSGGLLRISNVQQGSTIYLSTLKNCQIQIQCDSNGSVTGPSSALQGQQVTLQLFPKENYVSGGIQIGDTLYPAPGGDSFSFTIQADSVVTVHFLGKELRFLTVSDNLGHVRIENIPETYRYGDEIRLISEYDSSYVRFAGWSTGAYLSEGGTLVSTQKELTYTLTADTTLYANFAPRSSYTLRYDGNGGTVPADLTQEQAPGAYINLAVVNSGFQRSGYTLLGFSTEKDGGQLMLPGAMLQMPAADTTLFAQWAAQTPPECFTYTQSRGNITITGLTDRSLTALVLPERIDGKVVTAIADGALQKMLQLESVVLPQQLTTIGNGAFAGCTALETVYFPETITAMADSAFEGCDQLRNMRVLASLGRAFDYDYDSALVDKYMRLKHAPGKRLILVGGSNLAFGINSQLIAQQFPEYTVVNLGTSRHYGILPLFDLLRAQVRSGDVVVFAPEYYIEMYAGSQAATITNWQYLESNYDMLQDLDLQNNRSLLETYVDYLATKQSYLPDKKINPKPAYIRSGFNAYGDLVSTRACGGIYDLALPDKSILTEQGMANYNQLCRELTDRGASCCFSFPSRCAGGVSRSTIAEKTADFATALEKMLDSSCCTVISDIADYYFSGYVFYDSNYHMTLEGADIRTRQLIEDLAHFLEGA